MREVGFFPQAYFCQGSVIAVFALGTAARLVSAVGAHTAAGKAARRGALGRQRGEGLLLGRRRSPPPARPSPHPARGAPARAEHGRHPLPPLPARPAGYRPPPGHGATRCQVERDGAGAPEPAPSCPRPAPTPAGPGVAPIAPARPAPRHGAEVREASAALTVRRNWISSSPSPPSAMAAPVSPSAGRCSRCPGGRRRRSLPAGRRRRQDAHGRAAPGWGKCEGGGAGGPSPALAASGVRVPVRLQQVGSAARLPVPAAGRGMRLTGGGGEAELRPPPPLQVIRSPLPPHSKGAAQRPLPVLRGAAAAPGSGLARGRSPTRRHLRGPSLGLPPLLREPAGRPAGSVPAWARLSRRS